MDRQKPWLNSYPEQVPREIDLTRYRSVVQMLEEACERFRHRSAFSNRLKIFERHLTYQQLDELSQAFACYLVHELKLKKGDRVAIMLPNVLQYPIALFGTLRAGMVVVNVNPMYTPRELKHQLADSGAAAIVVLDNFAGTLTKILAETQIRHIVTTALADLFGGFKGPLINFIAKYIKNKVPDYSIKGAVRFNHALALGGKKRLPTIILGPNDIAFLQYTGGTTGVAKGAMLSHGNMVANMMQASAWVGFKTSVGEEVIITALPLYHIFALTVNCLVFMRLGGSNVLITDPRDLPGFVEMLKKTPFTVITGVNTLFNSLLNTPGFNALDFSRLKITVGGGMAVQKAVAEQWKHVTKLPIIEGYGLTETAPAVAMNPLTISDYTGAIGLPLPSTDIQISDEQDKPVPMGQIGELCVKGPQVMLGYWQRPDETVKVLGADGWFHTGDMAKIDERGYVFIVDRKKDMIIVSGFNVYPNEIEDVLAGMPGILEVAAVGVPDEKSGEAVKLVVVRKDPNLTAEEIGEFCKQNLTGYKRPKHIEFRNALPKTNVGKILRRELRDKAEPAHETTPAPLQG